MKNKKIKIILIILFILLLLLLGIVIILKNKTAQNGGLGNIFNNIQNTTDEEDEQLEEDEEFEDDEEPAIDEEMREEINSKNEGEQDQKSEDGEEVIDKYLEEFNEKEETNSTDIANEEQEGLRDDFYQDSPKEITNSIYYNTVKNIIQIFLNDVGTMSGKKYINKTNLEDISNSDLRKKTYDRLSENYIKDHEININNISEKMRISYSTFMVNIEKMMQYVIKGNNILRFSVRLNIQDGENSTSVNNFIVYLDYENQTYAIEPAGNGNIEDIKLDSNITEIKENINNVYIYTNVE